MGETETAIRREEQIAGIVKRAVDAQTDTYMGC